MNEKDAYVLVLEGVKMGAIVAVNGVVLGSVTDQFLRFKFLLNEDVFDQGIGESAALRRELSGSP